MVSGLALRGMFQDFSHTLKLLLFEGNVVFLPLKYLQLGLFVIKIVRGFYAPDGCPQNQTHCSVIASLGKLQIS